MSKEIMKAEFAVDMLSITQTHALAVKETAGLGELSVENDEDASNANDYLREWLRKLDAVSAMKKETLAPLKEAEKRINALFKPLIDVGAQLTGNVRTLLEKYELSKRQAQREAMALAAASASAAEPAALLEALAAVEDAAPTALAGTGMVYTWVIKRIVPDFLPDEYWIPDEAKLKALGKAHKGDKPPDVMGVIWEEEASSRVRR